MHIIRELFPRKDLIRELVFKDLKSRYSRPVLGFLWVFLSPLSVVAIFYIVFSVILRVETKETPFLLYLMSAIFPWRLFQDSAISSVTSLVDNKNLVKESRFPHLSVPLSIVITNTIIFLPSLVILIITAIFYLKGLPILIIFLPFVFATHLIVTFGISLIASILYVKWRDTKYILEAVLQILFYLTPAFYSLSLIKDTFKPAWFTVYIHNPFVGMLNLYRITTLKGFYPYVRETGISSIFFLPLCFAITVFIASLIFYKKNKDTLNDYLSY